MFRPYQPKDDVQKKPYYTDRFLVIPELPKEPVSEERLAADVAELEKTVGLKESYMMAGHAVVIVEAKYNKQALMLLQARGFEYLMELSAVDFLAGSGEFEIFYELLSISRNQRIRMKCRIQEKEAIESVSDLWRAANWQEREMYDMFGIIANNHPNLKRILMPDDWHDYPLRKTYPLIGDEFAQWYEVDKIYGKEFRDVIGPENRDPARVDRYDTTRFARLGHEVQYGAEPKDEPTAIAYQDKKRPILNDDMDPAKSKQLDKRK